MNDSGRGRRRATAFTLWPFCPTHLPKKWLRQWMRNNDERLRPYIVDVPAAWSRHSLPKFRFPHECFPRAINFVRMARFLNAIYVFGEASCGGWGQHGWAEIEDRVVFDPVQQQFYDKEGYYRSELAWAWYRFTRPATLYFDRRMPLEYRWDDRLRLPFARDKANPLTIDLPLAKEFYRFRGLDDATKPPHLRRWPRIQASK